MAAMSRDRTSPEQKGALVELAIAPMRYTVAGFAGVSSIGRYRSHRTIQVLERRGWCRVSGEGRRRVARITPKGRDQLALLP